MFRVYIAITFRDGYCLLGGGGSFPLQADINISHQ